MEIEETICSSLSNSVESPALEDGAGLVDRTGAGVGRAFSARMQGIRDGGRGIDASGCGAAVARGREETAAFADAAQFVVHDINNVLAVIGNGLRLLECEDDAARRKAIVRKMQHSITRGASLSRQLLDAARPRPGSTGGFVGGSRLAALADTLDQTLRPGITVRTDIAPDLWDFDADPEELYFALLNLCRNAADAIPDGGAITVSARNVAPSAGASRPFVEIAVADDGEGMSEEVRARAVTRYFTTKAAGGGTGLGLAQVRRFVEVRGGAVDIESKPGAGTLVRLFLPRAGDAAAPDSLAGTEFA